MITDEEYIQVLHISLNSAYQKTKEKTKAYMEEMIPSDKMNEGGFKISNKSDFMKGYAVSMFYMVSNSLDMAAGMLNIQKPANASKIKEDLQEEYSRKLCTDLDIQH